jgi:hypothetical protein
LETPRRGIVVFTAKDYAPPDEILGSYESLVDVATVTKLARTRKIFHMEIEELLYRDSVLLVPVCRRL